MSKHTPGPWIVGPANRGPVSGTVPVTTADYMDSHRSGQLVCSVYGTAAFSESNARLIAAAPDLLEALKKMRETYGEYACEVCDAADAAIAKATGETS